MIRYTKQDDRLIVEHTKGFQDAPMVIEYVGDARKKFCEIFPI